MATYKQTLLMPLPKKHVMDMGYDPRYGRGYRGRETENRNNDDINSIVTFFN